MIYLEKKNLIFVKSRKTAGTSFEIALSANSDSARDIITPLTPFDELIRFDQKMAFPMNWASNNAAEEKYREIFTHHEKEIRASYKKRKEGVSNYESNSYAEELKSLRRLNGIFSNHMRPARIRKRIGQDTFDNAVKITIVRHPYEKVVSWAWFMKDSPQSHRQKSGVNELISLVIEILHKDRNFYFINDKFMAINRFLRFENLTRDIKKLEKDFDLSLLAHLPHAKGYQRKDLTPAKEVLTRSQKDKIVADCRFEFDVLGYEP